MQLPGLTDSLAGVTGTPAKCRVCGAATRLANGLCLSCTLREALDEDYEGSRESFEAILAKSEVKDTHWRVGNYEVLEEIGRGGMGVIYRARQRHSRRIVALKRVASYHADSRETRERFRREAEAAASLDHPNILPIYEVGQGEDGLPFFSMKYAAGGSLQKAAPALRLDTRECVRLMAKVARASQHAHEHGIVHRDLKPGNILLDAHGEPFVTDFGLAKWLDTNTDLTRTLTIFGTPGYIAPEQAKGSAIKSNPAADIYSLGAILFSLFTGRPPFLGEHALAVIEQANQKPAPKLRSLVPSLDRDLETIVARCLEADPKARYQSAGALGDDLEHWLRHEPIRARRTGIFARGGKWVRRNPTTTMLIAVLVVLAAAIVGVTVWKSEPLPPPVAGGIAVLPFENLSGDPQNAFFADGVQDEILNDLAKIADLKVISRTSVMQYKAGAKRNLRQIANELGVAHVVEGSVQRATNRVRVTAQLIDAKTDTHLWVERYDRPLGDVFAIQSEIAKTIAVQLQAKLSPAEKAAIERTPTTNLVAYDRYLRAKKLWAFPTTRVPQDMREIIRLLEQAVAYDPTFLVAYCELARADAYVYHLGVDHTPTRVTLAEEARDAALRLGPDRAEPHLAAAWVAYHCYLDYDTALAEVASARHALPNDESVFSLSAYIARRQDHREQCIRNLERAIELDPRNVWLLTDVAQTYEFQRRFSEAAAAWDRVLAVVPEDPSTRISRGLIDLESRADMQPAQQALRTVLTDDPNAVDEIAAQWLDVALCRRDAAELASALASLPAEGIIPWNVRMPRSFFEGLAARIRNDANGAEAALTRARDEMEKIVHEQPDYAQALCVLGMIDAALGHKENAIREGRSAVELLPVTKDAWLGAALLTNLVITYAWVGEKDLAIKQLEEVLRIPSPVSYGQLKLHPFWDSLRGDPRFEELVEESKKPVALDSPRLLPAGIAVLPFENLSADPDNAFFADGVQDEILNDLAKIADLKVISRTSVMQYKSGAKRNLRQIANELGVAHVVEGSVQRSGNRVRVSAQLIDAKSDTHLWANSYDRPLNDVFAIQSEIAKSIATQLQAKLSSAEKSAIEQRPTTNLIAYDRYLRAEKLWAQQTTQPAKDIHEIIRLLDQAVANDPRFLLAYCELARTHAYLYFLGYDHTPARIVLAEQARDAALRLGFERGEPHLAAAYVAYWCYRDYDKGIAELDIAQRGLPNDPSVFGVAAGITRRQGHWEECIRNYQRAIELDPRNLTWLGSAGLTCEYERRFSEAAAYWDRALAVAPDDPTMPVLHARIALEARADTQPRHEAIQSVLAKDPSAIDRIADQWFDVAFLRRDVEGMTSALASLPPEGMVSGVAGIVAMPRSFLEGMAARVRRDSTAAEKAFTAARVQMEKILRAQPDYAAALCGLGMIDAALSRKEDALREGRRAVELLPVTKDAMAGAELLTNLAVIYAWVGEKELALTQLEEVLQIPSLVCYGRLRLDPSWDPLRGDPRFEKLLEESKKPIAMNSL